MFGGVFGAGGIPFLGGNPMRMKQLMPLMMVLLLKGSKKFPMGIPRPWRRMQQWAMHGGIAREPAGYPAIYTEQKQ